MEKTIIKSVAKVIVLLLVITSSLYAVLNALQLEEIHTEIMMAIVYVLLILILMLGLMIIILIVLSTIISGVKNIKYCNDEIFREIDEKWHTYSDNSGYFERKIAIIGHYYSDGGIIDKKIVDKGQIIRLYDRLDYLEKQISIWDEAMMYLVSMTLSVLASEYCTNVLIKNYSNVLVETISVFAFIVAFFTIIVLKYKDKGKAGSYYYMIQRFEKRLLEEKIRNYEDAIADSVQSIDMMMVQQNVISDLIRLVKREKNNRKKERLEQEIIKVDKLKLYKIKINDEIIKISNSGEDQIDLEVKMDNIDDEQMEQLEYIKTIIIENKLGNLIIK
ncbi:MAG: hypothetical protein E7302_14205 [Butyrivibrio sp.]|nr:hypothetical protein [Butyrivibrio sp.]